MIDKPLCFVLMPFGVKKDPLGGPDINFDSVYEDGIRPAIEAAGMEAIRADEERTGGIIHKPMFERLILCDFAVADLTTGNANVFYELGLRHAARPQTTQALFEAKQHPPFDLSFLRCLSYEAGNMAALKEKLTKRLTELRDLALKDAVPDSPVFQLLENYGAPDIKRLKTDSFRDRARYEADTKAALAKARRNGDAGEARAIEQRLGQLDGVEAGVLVDLFLTYRALKHWDDMLRLYERIPAALQRTTMIQEQRGFALNRLGRRDEALEVLEKIVEARGANSETNGLIGRVYKDLWTEARKSGNEALAAGYLDRSINAYLRGFESDWRDAYPGVNAVTLLDVRGDEESLRRKAELLPVVRYAVKQRLRSAKPDYWDYATLLELAVLDSDEQDARTELGRALAAVREVWEPETTANNLSMIRAARQARGDVQPWLDDVIAALQKH